MNRIRICENKNDNENENDDIKVKDVNIWCLMDEIYWQ